jgi:catechol 2,3-dioxygenase-like lactoylglutathione lyase family enzyme
LKLPERNQSGEWLERAVGLPGAELKGAHLLLPGYGENGPTLEVFSYGRMEERELPMANHVGFTHIAFEVDDVESVLELALEKGGSVLGEVTEKEIEGAGTIKFLYFWDPEGNIVELQSWGGD